MSETRTEYVVSGLTKGPNPRSLLLNTHPDYIEPSWEDVRALVHEVDVTGAVLAAFMDVRPRTVRKWMSPPTAANHAPIPFTAWRLLLIAAGKVPAPDLATLKATPPHTDN